MNRSIILASFVFPERLETFLAYLQKRFKLDRERIFIYDNIDDPITKIVTYKVFLKDGKKIFIHCRCGIQRSANLVSALLIYSRGYKPDEAFSYVKSKRNIVFFPLNNYRLSVERYNKLISKK